MDNARKVHQAKMIYGKFDAKGGKPPSLDVISILVGMNKTTLGRHLLGTVQEYAGGKTSQKQKEELKAKRERERSSGKKNRKRSNFADYYEKFTNDRAEEIKIQFFTEKKEEK